MKSKIFGMIPKDMGDLPTNKFSGLRTGVIQVRQRCNSCNKYIVKTALSVVGVKKAEWNNDSNVLLVEFDAQKTNLNTVELEIVEAGYETPNHRGNIKYYSQIPNCCQYVEELSSKI